MRALVRVRWPRTGKPARCRLPRQVPRSISRLMFIDTSRRRSPSIVNFVDLFPQPVHLAVGQVLDLGRAVDARGRADRRARERADAEDRRQRDLGVLLVRNVDATYTGHALPSSQR